MTMQSAPSLSAPPRRFYVGMAVFLTATVFIGFAPSFYLAPWFERPPVPVFAIVHGLIFSAWMILLIAQTWLVAERNVALHRKLGMAGAALALIMVIAATTAAIASVTRGFTPYPGIQPPIPFSIVPFSTIPVFAILVGVALAVRKRDSATHKRLMLIATIAIAEAAIARWPLPIMMTGSWSSMLVTEAMLLAVIAYDTAANKRLHPAMLWGGLLILASHVIRPVVGPSAAWENFIRALIS